jgi:MoxR-like ATPase
VSYGTADEELDVLGLPHRGLAPDFMGDVRPILGPVELDRAQRDLDSTELPEDVARYVVALIRATRDAPGVRLGASPRASVHLAAAAKARARLNGRDAVAAVDVAGIAPFVLRHRLIMEEGADRVEAMRAAIASVPPPT